MALSSLFLDDDSVGRMRRRYVALHQFSAFRFYVVGLEGRVSLMKCENTGGRRLNAGP